MQKAKKYGLKMQMEDQMGLLIMRTELGCIHSSAEVMLSIVTQNLLTLDQMDRKISVILVIFKGALTRLLDTRISNIGYVWRG